MKKNRHRMHIQIGVYHVADKNLSIALMCDRAYLAIDSIKNSLGRVIVKFNTETEAGMDAEVVVPVYSVLTCLKMLHKDDPKAPVENPYLLGLTLEYKNYMKDKQFMRLLVKHISAGKFVVPIQPAQPSENGGKPIIKLITLNILTKTFNMCGTTCCININTIWCIINNISLAAKIIKYSRSNHP